MTCLLSLEEKEFWVGVGNRTRVEIIASMLNAARDWTPKTHIMYRANLSHRQLRRYFTFILDNGLLEKAQSVTYKTNLYHITEKGLSVLRDYFRLSARLNGGPPQRSFVVPCPSNAYPRLITSTFALKWYHLGELEEPAEMSERRVGSCSCVRDRKDWIVENISWR
jgi:predicted transcriptional regulator